MVYIHLKFVFHFISSACLNLNKPFYVGNWTLRWEWVVPLRFISWKSKGYKNFYLTFESCTCLKNLLLKEIRMMADSISLHKVKGGQVLKVSEWVKCLKVVDHDDDDGCMNVWHWQRKCTNGSNYNQRQSTQTQWNWCKIDFILFYPIVFFHCQLFSRKENEYISKPNLE
jgi:hypothetical protein